MPQVLTSYESQPQTGSYALRTEISSSFFNDCEVANSWMHPVRTVPEFCSVEICTRIQLPKCYLCLDREKAGMDVTATIVFCKPQGQLGQFVNLWSSMLTLKELEHRVVPTESCSLSPTREQEWLLISPVQLFTVLTMGSHMRSHCEHFL